MPVVPAWLWIGLSPIRSPRNARDKPSELIPSHRSPPDGSPHPHFDYRMVIRVECGLHAHHRLPQLFQPLLRLAGHDAHHCVLVRRSDVTQRRLRTPNQPCREDECVIYARVVQSLGACLYEQREEVQRGAS